MGELSKKVFRGIRQVSISMYNSCDDKEGYLWLVKDGKKRYVYFGSQLYADIDADGDDKNIQDKIDATLNSLIEQDLLHSFDAKGKLKNELSFKLDESEDGNPMLHLVGKDNEDVASIDMSEFVVDGMIESIDYDKTAHTLTITWNTDSGKKPVTIDLSNLIDIYTAGNGIEVSDKGVISIKVADDSQDYLVLDKNGIKIINVDGSHIEIGKEITDDKGKNVDATKKITDVLQDVYDTIKDVEAEAISVDGDGKSVEVHSDDVKSTKKIISVKSEKATENTVNDGHIEIVNTSDNGIYGQMYYMTNTESIHGDITTGAINSDSVSIYNATVKDNVRLRVTASDEVEIEDVTFSGDFPKSTANAIAAVNGGQSVILTNITFDDTSKGYNAIEIGLNGDECPKYVDISGCTFNGSLSNNAILIFGTANDAVINIRKCHFGTVSNCLRLSNRLNARNVVVNIKDCTVDQWDTNPLWEGFLICEDYTSKSVEKEKENNLFGDGKITVNFTNLMYKGQKVMDEKSQRVTYVWNDYGNTVTDEKYLPIVNFK